MPGRDKRKRRHATVIGASPRQQRQRQRTLNDLPPELLLQIFSHLARLPPIRGEHDLPTPAHDISLPFHTLESPEPHPGLRAYPFLAQVCRRWKALLESPSGQQALWGELVIDFGHELVTAVHTPIRWSDTQPSDQEFRQAFAAVRLDAHRLVDFVRHRRGVLRSLSLMNSEGYWAEDGEFVNLASKHNFGLATFGLTLGMLQEQLTQLRILHCNDLFSMGSPLGVIATLRGLRSLELDGLHCRVYREPAAELGRLTQLERLAVNAVQRHGAFIFGVDAIPDTWRQLCRLTHLELRGNALLEALPTWLPSALPHLAALDISYCTRLDLSNVTALTQLRMLSMQNMDLIEPGLLPQQLMTQAAQGGAPPRVKLLPSLAGMTNLTALCLSDNNLARVPPELSRMVGLEYLDLSGCLWLQAKQPLTPMQALQCLRFLDLRAIHVEESRFWSADKCATMQHVAALARTLRRRCRHVRVLYDTS